MQPDGAMAAADTHDAGDNELLRQLGVNQKLKRFCQWYMQTWRADESWRSHALTARRYVSGEQWREEDLELRRKTRRPALVINKILPRVLFLQGQQRAQREEPKLLPFEGGDARACELMGALYKYEGTKCREPVVDSRVFDDKIVTGLGFWKVSWPTTGENLEGDLVWERVDPLAVFPDPHWHDNGWENARYVIQATWFTLEEAIERWPDHEEEIKHQYGEWLNGGTSATTATSGSGEAAGDSLAAERPFWDAETQRFRVLEVWYRMRVTVDAVQFGETGEISTDPKKVAMIGQVVAQQPEMAAAFTPLQMPVTRVFVAHCTDGVLLDDQPTPYEAQEFPIFPTRGYYWERVPFGVVKPIVPLQDEVNVRRSAIIEMTQKATNSGWQTHETQGPKKADLEQHAAGAGKVLVHRGTPAEQIEPPQIPQTLGFLERSAGQDMDHVSNINAELLGTSSQRTVSGRALQRRQASAMVVQEPLLESFRQDKEPAVKFAIACIKQFLSPAKAVRILGTMVRRQPEGPLAQQMEGMELFEVRELLQGTFSQDFDVVVSSQPFDPSMQVARWQQIAEMFQQFGAYIPPDVIVSAAKNAGLITEEEAQKTLAFAQQRMALDQQQQAAATAGQAPAPPNRAA